MTSQERMCEVMIRIYDGDASGEGYAAQALKTVLKEVSPEKASLRPIPGAHTIWEIMVHLVGYREAVRKRLEGRRRSHERNDYWNPVANLTPAAWKRLMKRLDVSQRGLLEGIRRLDDPGYARVEGSLRFLIHHDLYHAGQIGVLRRAVL